MASLQLQDGFEPYYAGRENVLAFRKSEPREPAPVEERAADNDRRDTTAQDRKLSRKA